MAMNTIKGQKVIERKENAKNRFRVAFENYMRIKGKTVHEISLELGIPTGTINDTLSRNNRTLSADLVAAFCAEYRTVDLNYIYLGEIGKIEEHEDNYTKTWNSSDCHPLEDETFMGAYYGYCRNTQDSNKIDTFLLDIKPTTDNSVQAELRLKTFDQKGKSFEKILYGTPMHLEPNIIYVVCQSKEGDDMLILSYNYFKINSGKKLYCRYGSLITPCRATNRYPELQSFVLLDKPILPKNFCYIDGFLNLTQDKILVRADLYDAETGGLMATDKNVMMFFSLCNDMRYNKEHYYCFSEKVLLALGEANGVDYDTSAATIMMLRKNSVNPKVVNFPNNKTFSKFFAALTNDE